MALKSFTIQSMVDTTVFTDFSYFHNFILGNRKGGFLFSTVFLIALAFLNLYTGSLPLFTLCIGLAVGVPGLYYLFYRRSLRNQIKANHLETPREAYTLVIDEKGVNVANGTEQATYLWDNIFRVYRTSKYVYIYIIKNKAFILPLKDLKGGTPDALWKFVTDHTDRNRFFHKI